jgi:hypothetical protein
LALHAYRPHGGEFDESQHRLSKWRVGYAQSELGELGQEKTTDIVDRGHARADATTFHQCAAVSTE